MHRLSCTSHLVRTSLNFTRRASYRHSIMAHSSQVRVQPRAQCKHLSLHHTSPVQWKRVHSTAAYGFQEDEELFRYTSGRFIHDEAQQLADRYVSFHVAGLQSSAASACGAQRAVGIRKFSEGAWNKDVILALDNGMEVVARLSTRIAPPPQYHLANQVATMDYVRTRLGVPAPKVLAWSADTNLQTNPVGAPYILTEKPSGTCLAFVWDELSDTLKDAVVVEWAGMEARLMEAVSDGYGSIFYRRDLPTGHCYALYTGDRREDDFVVGPDMHKQFWNDGRKELDVERGPFRTSLDYMLALSAQERVWLRKNAVSKTECGWLDPPAEIQVPELHLQLLDRYDTIAPHLIPSDPALFRPILLYNQLHLGSIYVSQEALDAGRIEITAVVDWMFTSLHPSFISACVPSLFRHHETPPEARVAALYDASVEDAAAQRHELYVETTRAYNPVIHKALTWPPRRLVGELLQNVYGMWDDGYAPFSYCLFRIYKEWHLFHGLDTPCPLHYTAEEIEATRKLVMDWQTRTDGKAKLRKYLKIDETAEVHPDIYDVTVKDNERYKQQMADMMSQAGIEDRDVVLRTWPWRP